MNDVQAEIVQRGCSSEEFDGVRQFRGQPGLAPDKLVAGVEAIAVSLIAAEFLDWADGVRLGSTLARVLH